MTRTIIALLATAAITLPVAAQQQTGPQKGSPQYSRTQDRDTSRDRRSRARRQSARNNQDTGEIRGRAADRDRNRAQEARDYSRGRTAIQGIRPRTRRAVLCRRAHGLQRL